MHNKLTYDIAIPVLNEQNRLRKGIETFIQFINANQINHCRIIIADNGSTDSTIQIADELSKQYPDIVRYISLNKRGVGLALKSAFNTSTADVVGYMDVDLATDLSHFVTVVELMEKNPNLIVNGSRNLSQSKVMNRKLIRSITSYGFNQCLKLFLNVHFTDGMCGFKFLSRNVYEHINQKGLHNDGWFFCTELLCIGEWLNYSIHEIPVHWEDDQDSRVKLVSLSKYYLQEIFKLRNNPLRVKQT